jgi:hypothetical protein
VVGSGGPWFFGHSASSRNAWSDQARQVNAVFAAIDEEQKTRALVTRAEQEANRLRSLRGEPAVEAGISIAELDAPRKAMVRSLLSILVAPFASYEATVIASCLDPQGPVGDSVRLTIYEQGDSGPGTVWKIEGPSFAWYHHGSPHVHSWVRFSGGR